MTDVPTMKIVASEVPPTGTFSRGTGNASATAVTMRSVQTPARVSALGSEAAKADAATVTVTISATTTGSNSGRSHTVSRPTSARRRPFVSGPLSTPGAANTQVMPRTTPGSLILPDAAVVPASLERGTCYEKTYSWASDSQGFPRPYMTVRAVTSAMHQNAVCESPGWLPCRQSGSEPSWSERISRRRVRVTASSSDSVMSSFARWRRAVEPSLDALASNSTISGCT